MWLCPDYVLDSYEDVTPEFLRQHRISLLLTDIDYTLARRKTPEADEKNRQWLDALQKAGISVMAVSNNRSPVRAKRFCDSLGIDFISYAQKPSRRGFFKAMEKCGTTQAQTAMLGDKLLTDVWGAKRCGILMLMVEPLGGATGRWQKVLYVLQEPFKRLCSRDLRSKRQKERKNSK